MKFEHANKPEYILTLTANEAKWLQGVMQNPLWCNPLIEESKEDRVNRSNLFYTLKDILEGLV